MKIEKGYSIVNQITKSLQKKKALVIVSIWICLIANRFYSWNHYNGRYVFNGSWLFVRIICVCNCLSLVSDVHVDCIQKSL
jgi:hypothetical protein